GRGEDGCGGAGKGGGRNGAVVSGPSFSPLPQIGGFGFGGFGFGGFGFDGFGFGGFGFVVHVASLSFLEERLDVSPSTASARRCGEAGTRRAHGAEPAALGSEAPVRAGAFLFRELLSSFIAQGWGQRGGLQWPRRRRRAATQQETDAGRHR